MRQKKLRRFELRARLCWGRRFPAAVGDLSVPTPTAAENANGQLKKYPGI